jgi:hypothetical protein
MAVHYPADYDVFSVVCMDHPGAGIADPGLLRECRAKLSRYDDRYGEFMGSAEDPKTFRVVLDLEQMMGREIFRVRGESFESLVGWKKAVPNQAWRFCTTEMKMRPIAEWVYHHVGEKVLNCQGIRVDEAHRLKSDGHRSQVVEVLVGRTKTGRRRRWEHFEFGEACYPLVFGEGGELAAVRKPDIYAWAAGSGLDFPVRSNCQFCFHKNVSELIENNGRHPGIFEAAVSLESSCGSSMKKDLPLDKVRGMVVPPVQLSFFGGDSCESGYCTD